MYEIKQNIIQNNEAKGVFLELVHNDGNNTNFKMLPELVAWSYMLMPWGFFSNDDPRLTLIILWQGQICFLMLLYGWQLIQHRVLMYFQVCSNSAYPQHSGERYKTSGPLVLYVCITLLLCYRRKVRGGDISHFWIFTAYQIYGVLISWVLLALDAAYHPVSWLCLQQAGNVL